MRLSLVIAAVITAIRPWLFAADSDFLKVFPASPAIPNLSYSGQLSYTQTYTPSGSTWAPGLDEHEVFFASLKHAEGSDNSWEVRLGKGGQIGRASCRERVSKQV